MKALLDTCVVVDFLQKRDPFAEDALRIFQYMAMNQFTGFITAKSATDLFYLSHRNLHSNEKSRILLQKLLGLVGLLDTAAVDIQTALFSEMTDYEDAVMAETGKRSGMDCLITRNKKHYGNCSLPVYEPKEFLHLLEESEGVSSET